jgi:hypothetical protein
VCVCVCVCVCACVCVVCVCGVCLWCVCVCMCLWCVCVLKTGTLLYNCVVSWRWIILVRNVWGRRCIKTGTLLCNCVVSWRWIILVRNVWDRRYIETHINFMFNNLFPDILYFSDRASWSNSGKWPTWRTISSIICLFESSTCFEQLWTLTASQRRRIEAAEMKLLRPLAGYVLYDHKTNDSIRREL